MVDFDRFEKDIRATFDLLDDIKTGEGLNWDRINKFFESPLFKRRNKTARDKRFSDFSDKFSSFPRFGSRQSATESSETDSGDEVYSSRTFRRSDSTYSTSSYDTTDSSDTLSGDSTGTKSRFHKREAKVERQIPVQHYRTSSSSSSQGLSKKLENQFLKEERHSVPHELYSERDREGNSDRYFRPVSAPAKPDPALFRNDFNHDSASSFKCFPSRAMDSQVFESHQDVNSNNVTKVSNQESNNNVSSGKSTAQNRPEVCQTSARANSRDRTLPDVLKKDGLSGCGPPSFGLESNENSTWEERQDRIECALKWLRSELGLLRAQDKVLLSQLKRCQDTIEVIKKQREEFNEIDEDEEGHWEDWEIAEFDRRCENGEIIDDLPKNCKDSAVPNTPEIRQDIQVQI